MNDSLGYKKGVASHMAAHVIGKMLVPFLKRLPAVVGLQTRPAFYPPAALSNRSASSYAGL